MASAMLNIRVHHIRMLSKAAAADYCGLSVHLFEKEFPLPAVCMASGKLSYDIRDLDRWIDSRKSGENFNADAIVERLG